MNTLNQIDTLIKNGDNDYELGFNAALIACSKILIDSDDNDAWIELVQRPLTSSEKTVLDTPSDEIYDCPLPEDGDLVLVSTVDETGVDTFVNDNGSCYFEHFDIEDVIAWQPLPKPFRSNV